MISPEISITNRTPIQALNQGDLIMAGGFPVKLTKVTGGGSFSGEGYVTIPMLGQVNVKVRFSGIQVNTERQLFGGVIETTYDPNEKQIADTRQIAEDLTTLINEIANLIKKRKDFTDQYTGTEENKKAAEILGKDENEIYNEILKSPYLTDEEKTALKAEQNAIGDAYTGLSGDGCDGNTVTPKKGPNIDFLNFDDYSKCKEILARATKIKEYADKAKERETLNNEKEKQDLASSTFINVDPSAKVTSNVTAFLTPGGEAIYLDRANIQVYICDPISGVVKGFTLKNKVKYSYDAKSKTYTDLSGQAFPLIQAPEKGTIESLLLKKLNCEVQLYAVYIISPNTSGNIPALASGKLKETIAIKCLDGYFREHGAAYVSALEKLYTIFEYFDKCSAGNWAPYENGIVPYCFWKNSNIDEAAYYSVVDLPYRAGIIDGGYGQVKGLIDLSANLNKIIYAYAIGSVGCENLVNTLDDYNTLISEIDKLSKKKGIINYVKKAYDEYKVKGYEQHAAECFESKKIIEETSTTIDRLYEIANDDGKLFDIGITVAQKLGTYVNKLSGNDEIGRYEKGKLTADLLTLFIGAEEANGTKRLLEFQEYLAQKATVQEVERLGAKVAERTLITQGKIVEKLWTKIDEIDGLFNGHNATFYDVNAIYQSSRPRAGVAFLENNILEFHLNIPEKLQGQGIGQEIFKRAIDDYSPLKVKGWWKKSDIYSSGESTNLTIFRKKIKEGLSAEKAVFETPTGNILKENGFDGKVEIIKNTDDEVLIHFNHR